MGWAQQFLIEGFVRAESRSAEKQLSARALRVEALGSDGKAFAAVDSDGSWALVIVTRKSDAPPAPLQLSLLSADYGTRYDLYDMEGVVSMSASVVRCTSHDPAVRDLFATFCHSLICQLPVEPTDLDVSIEVDKWVKLFWRLQSPPRTTLVGLIGELTILDRAEKAREWIRAWHLKSTDNLDFAFSVPPLSVEVKATTSQQRIHDIALSQLAPSDTGSHYFASVIVELRESGTRLGDVVDEIAESVMGQPEFQMFWDSFVDVCGSSLGEFLDARYMRADAKSSVHFYSAGCVPCPYVDLPLPTGVSKLRFLSDFSSSAPAESEPILDLQL